MFDFLIPILIGTACIGAIGARSFSDGTRQKRRSVAVLMLSVGMLLWFYFQARPADAEILTRDMVQRIILVTIPAVSAAVVIGLLVRRRD